MSEIPKRRWFRFRLSTLFVLTALFAPFLGWQANIVRERKLVLGIARERGAAIAVLEDIPMGLLRDLMGDQRIYSISVYDYTEEEFTRLQSAFPEALISRDVFQEDL
jgi:hypothetical protein